MPILRWGVGWPAAMRLQMRQILALAPLSISPMLPVVSRQKTTSIFGPVGSWILPAPAGLLETANPRSRASTVRTAAVRHQGNETRDMVRNSFEEKEIVRSSLN